jgi:hypothetical protein
LEEIIMRHAFRFLTSMALALSLSVAIGSNAARAQGSSGGSIGNDDKSVSGSRPDSSRSVEPDQSTRRSKPEADAPQRAPRKGGGGGGGNFDGVWAYVGIGTNCQGTGSGTITISGGRVSAPGGSGTVSPNGSYRSRAVGSDGISLTATGRLSGNSGSGIYMRSDGCGGRWSATRQ